MPTSGEGLQLLGHSLTLLGGEMKREEALREYNAATTAFQTGLSKEVDSLLVSLKQNSYEGLVDKDTREDLGKQQIADFLQSKRDLAERTAQNNPQIAMAYNKMIQMADVHLNHHYGILKAEKSKEYDRAEYINYSTLMANQYVQAGSDTERMKIVAQNNERLAQLKNNGSVSAEEAMVWGKKWFTQAHSDYATSRIQAIDPSILGDVKVQNEMIAKLTNRAQFPYLDEGSINSITKHFRDQVTHMISVQNQYDAYASEKAISVILSEYNKNPDIFKNSLDVDRFAEAKGLKLRSDERLKINHYIANGATSDVNSIVSILSSGQGYGPMMRDFKNLYLKGKLSNHDAEKYIQLCLSGIEHDKDRNAVNPYTNPQNHLYSSLFDHIAQNSPDPSTKNAATAARISFYNYVADPTNPLPPDAAFVKAAIDNKVTVSSRWIPQLPQKYQHDNPAYSRNLIEADTSLSENEKKKLKAKIEPIIILKQIEEKFENERRKKEKQKGMTVTGAPLTGISDVQYAYP